LFQALMLGHLCAAIYVIYLYRKRSFHHQQQTQTIPTLPNKQQNNNLGEQV